MDGTEDKHVSKKSSLSILLSEKNGNTHEKTTNEDIWYDASIPMAQNASDARRSPKAADNLDSAESQSSKISCKDLILAIYENELCGSDCDDEKPVIDASVPVQDQFRLLAAEEDGTPMDDLPEFSSNTDVLAMGIEDFVLMSKKSSEKLVHVRITQGGDRSLTKIKNGSTFPVMQYSECEAELNKQPSLGFVDMLRQDSDFSNTDDSITSPVAELNSLENSGFEAPKMFRTQSEDELFAVGGELGLECTGNGQNNNRNSSVDNLSTSVNSTDLRMSDYKNSFEATSSYSTTATSEALRKRSWSENLIISCRRPGTDHWSSPRNIVLGVAGRSSNRKRANTGVTQMVKTPQRPIPSANGQFHDDEKVHDTQGLSIHTYHNGAASSHHATNGKSMKYFIDTGIDPLKQYQSEQEILHLRSASSSSLPNEDMILSLNPHTSSSKLVLTPTNGPGSVTGGGSRPSSAVTPLGPTGPGTPIPGSGGNNISSNSFSGGHKTAGLPPTVPTPSSASKSALTSKELAAYFNERDIQSFDRQYSSDLSDVDEEDHNNKAERGGVNTGVGGGASTDEYDSGGEHVFSFVDSPEAPKMYAKNRNPSQDESVDTTAKGGSSVNEEEPVRGYSSGSDYSASDYEALHKINRDLAEFHLHNNTATAIMRGGGGSSSSSSGNRNRSVSENPKHLAFNGTASAKMALNSASNDESGRRRTSSEAQTSPRGDAARRPSWFQQLVGLVAGPTSPSKSISNGTSPKHRDSNASRSSFIGAILGVGATATGAADNEEQEEEDDEGECSFVKDLSTGEVICLDEDGDGAVTAVLISPDLIYGGPAR